MKPSSSAPHPARWRDKPSILRSRSAALLLLLTASTTPSRSDDVLDGAVFRDALVPPWSRQPEQAHPASQATFGPDGARGSIDSVDRFGNLTTELVAADLETLGLSVGDTLRITACGQTIEVLFAELVTDVGPGEWFALVGPAGTLTIGRNYERAAETIGCAAGEAIRQ